MFQKELNCKIALKFSVCILNITKIMAIQVQTCKMEFMKQVLPRFTRPGGWSDDKKNNNKTEQISSELIMF